MITDFSSYIGAVCQKQFHRTYVGGSPAASGGGKVSRTGFFLASASVGALFISPSNPTSSWTVYDGTTLAAGVNVILPQPSGSDRIYLNKMDAAFLWQGAGTTTQGISAANVKMFDFIAGTTVSVTAGTPVTPPAFPSAATLAAARADLSGGDWEAIRPFIKVFIVPTSNHAAFSLTYDTNTASGKTVTVSQSNTFMMEAAAGRGGGFTVVFPEAPDGITNITAISSSSGTVAFDMYLVYEFPTNSLSSQASYIPTSFSDNKLPLVDRKAWLRFVMKQASTGAAKRMALDLDFIHG